MDVQLNRQPQPSGLAAMIQQIKPSHAIFGYWALATLIGVPFLWDLLSTWNLPQTMANGPLVLVLLATLACGQGLYVAVARHNGRPIRPLTTVIFALGNGIAETFAFVAVYRVGELLGSGIAALVWPSAASGLGFAFGLIGFVIYGGLIHALFWMPLLPPHFDDSPRSLAIRKIRPLAEVGLVVGWSLCLWLYQDIWTVMLLHTIVDFGLMLRVRPGLWADESP